jgi:hypothetical protein
MFFEFGLTNLDDCANHFHSYQEPKQKAALVGILPSQRSEYPNPDMCEGLVALSDMLIELIME